MKMMTDIVHTFTSAFRTEEDIRHGRPRAVGLENEYVMVSEDGTILRPEVLEALWNELACQGWQLSQDPVTGKTTAATRPAITAATKGTHGYHVITTDLAYSTLEIDVAPAQSLHEARASLCQLIGLITPILKKHRSYLLGYGVQPIAPPSRWYIGPKNRYTVIFDSYDSDQPETARLFQSPQSGSSTDERSALVDSGHLNRETDSVLGLQCLNASGQTQVEISVVEAIPLVNAFNATSGLRTALCANSPIWQNTISEYKAIRELFWDWSYAHRGQQFGIPPRFQSLEHYVDYLFDFRSILVSREQIAYRIDNHVAFRTLASRQDGYVGIASDGRQATLRGSVEDLYTQHACAWFDARLHPLHGTIEDRVSCQQPPHAHFCANALTLGLVENGADIVELANKFSLDQWREIRQLACIHGPQFTYPGVEIKHLFEELVQIAATGLKRRGLGEEIYLEPLYKRIEQGRCPADDAIEQFHVGGVGQMIGYYDMEQLSQQKEQPLQ